MTSFFSAHRFGAIQLKYSAELSPLRALEFSRSFGRHGSRSDDAHLPAATSFGAHSSAIHFKCDGNQVLLKCTNGTGTELPEPN